MKSTHTHIHTHTHTHTFTHTHTHTLTHTHTIFLVRCPSVTHRNGVLRTHKFKTHLLRNQSSKVLPFKSGAGPYIAMHAMPTARDFFLANFYPSGLFACIFFPESLPSVFSVLTVANIGSCVGSQNEIGQPAGDSRVEWLRNMNRLQKHDLWYDDL